MLRPHLHRISNTRRSKLSLLAFPHRYLPRCWQETAEGADAHEGSLQPRRITLISHPRAIQNSHIIPASEKRWLAENDMHIYGNLSGRGGQDVADMSENIFKLRTDLHQLWDALEFSIVPKRNTADNGALWTVHSMSEDRELLELYHNVPLQTLGRPPESESRGRRSVPSMASVRTNTFEEDYCELAPSPCLNIGSQNLEQDW